MPGGSGRGGCQKAPVAGDRPRRPPAEAWLAEPEGFSLPSKHTTLAVLTVGAAVRALGIRGAPANAAMAIAAAGVGASRVCLGVHWPADVVAGWLFAVGWLHLTDPDLRPAHPGMVVQFCDRAHSCRPREAGNMR